MQHSDLQPDLDRLRAIEKTGLLTCPPPPEFLAICAAARDRFAVPVALVTLPGRVLAASSEGLPLAETPRLHPFCDQTVQGDEVLVVPDAARDPRFAACPLVRGRPFLRFYAGAPLHYVRHVRLGALCLLDTRPRDFGAEDRAALERMAETLAAAVLEQEFDRLSARLAH